MFDSGTGENGSESSSPRLNRAVQHALVACKLSIRRLSSLAQSQAKNHQHPKTIRVNLLRDPSDDE